MRTIINLRSAFILCVASGLASAGLDLNRVLGVPPSPSDDRLGMQVLTRGPVHEAFAETVSFDPEPGMIVPKAPPKAIVELPPELRPEGTNVTWIPGYWAWDDEQKDFLWISGVWRALPPGREWVAGYWGRIAQGAQWTSGYWADADTSETDYLPVPPETMEVGANIPAPSPNDTWIPGCWIWEQGRYVWRPGHWEPVEPNWDWIPDHYVYAPRGFIFVSGYWDYPVVRRGILFAPVHFAAGVSARRGFSYSPTTVISLDVFTDQLFVRPRYHHYYFGDYYAASYQDAGFYASAAYQAGHRGYDPIYAHQSWDHRQDHDWTQHAQAEFQNRRDHEDARPVRTLAVQLKLGAAAGGPRGLVVAGTLDQLTKTKDGPVRFQPLDKQERAQLVRRGQEVQKFRVARQKVEKASVSPAAEKSPRAITPARLKLPRSPIISRSSGQLGKDSAPPKRLQSPKTDPTRKPQDEPKDKNKDNDKSRER